MDDLSLTDFPELSFSIDEEARRLFSEWLTLAGHETPHRLIIDKSQPHEAGNDLRHTLLDAWNTIAKKETRKLLDQDWCIEFMTGYVQSSLSVGWSQEFLELNLDHKNAF